MGLCRLDRTRETIIKKVLTGVSHWRKAAAGIGIPRNEMHSMESAFYVME
jgi:hypothetical protein